MVRNWTTRAAAVTLAAAALLVGCGGDDDADAVPEEATTVDVGDGPSTTAAPTTTEGTTTTAEAPTTAAPTPSTTAPLATTTPATGAKAWRDLGAGECIGALPEGTFTEVTVVACAEPHAAEAITPITAVRITGDDADASAQATCDQAFAPYAGPGREASYILETQGTLLARAVCLVVDPSGAPLTGSVVAG